MKSDKRYIILMADIINSKNMEQPIGQKKFKALVNDINHKFSSAILSPLTITLGDEFQGVIKNVEAAVKIIIEFEETMLFNDSPFALRYIVYEGEIDTRINHQIAHGMVGEGLREARKKLTWIKKMKKKIIFILDDEIKRKFYDNLFLLFEMFIKNWNRKDGTLIEWLLKEPDYKRVANRLKKTPSLIWKRRKSLNIDPYIALKNLLLNAK